MTTESAGLWLIGIGALLVALVGLSAGRVRLALTFEGSGDQRADRVKFAVSGAGLVSTAAGSVLIAVSSTPNAKFAAATIAALLLVAYLLIVWRVQTLWREHVAAAGLNLKVNQDSEREQWRLDATRLCARWRWALAHPLTAADARSWPVPYLERKLGPCPPGPPESAEAPLVALKLRQNRPNVAQALVAELPSWTQDVVLVARDCAWSALRSNHTLALYTPDGEALETANLDGAPPLVELLRRDVLLRALAARGLPTHRGSRGQLAPGRDRAHIFSVLARSAEDGEQGLRPR